MRLNKFEIDNLIKDNTLLKERVKELKLDKQELKKQLTLTDVVSQLVCPNNEQHIVKKEYANKYCMVCGVLK